MVSVGELTLTCSLKQIDWRHDQRKIGVIKGDIVKEIK